MTLGGSSPRARGTLQRAPDGVHGRRVIPACAGNTTTTAATGPPRPGHPRVRGEHSAISPPLLNPSGSSPRARGTLPGPVAGAHPVRVIPACAGNTGSSRPGGHQRSGHPRVRGEHCNGHALSRNGDGSSPRARGTRKGLPRRRVGLRVIPACAGNTRGPPIRTRPGPGHPRVRGEHMISERRAS